ncbi:MAG: putative homoserine kinase, partial [Phycisphaerales bacterium]|nr:putative homoserine kinase [Phycisphaerales bacterium]
MKYAIIIPDGAADDAVPELGGRTPLQAAHTPNMDEIARMGQLGTVRTVPEGFESGSDVATMSLLGYDPAVYHTGRAPLEAAAQRIPLTPSDWVFRCNFVTTKDGLMKDHSAGGISDAEGRRLLSILAKSLDTPGFEFHPGVSYRNLLVYKGKQGFDLKTKPPHEMLDEPLERWLPTGEGSEILRDLMTKSAEVLAASDAGAASQIWLWGQGHPPAMPTFAERFGVSGGAMISGVDLLRGLANLLGWGVVEVPGMTSFHDTDYAGQGAATCAALEKYNLVVSHVESPDEASHQADVKTKIAAIEAIDRHVVGPVLAALRQKKDWRILILPDNPTNVATRKHGYAPTLYAMAGTGLTSNGATAYDEVQAARGLSFAQGDLLMPAFLG